MAAAELRARHLPGRFSSNMVQFASAKRRVEGYLEGLDPKKMRRGALLSWMGSFAVNMIMFSALMLITIQYVSNG
jgi:hypothetical protein